MAETTTTSWLSALAARIISTTCAMQDASPTDVPPNFITRIGFLRSRRCSSVRGWCGAKCRLWKPARTERFVIGGVITVVAGQSIEFGLELLWRTGDSVSNVL